MSTTDDEKIIANFEHALDELLKLRVITKRPILTERVNSLLAKAEVLIEFRIV